LNVDQIWWLDAGCAEPVGAGARGAPEILRIHDNNLLHRPRPAPISIGLSGPPRGQPSRIRSRWCPWRCGSASTAGG